MMRSCRAGLVAVCAVVSLGGCFSPARIAPVEDVYNGSQHLSQLTNEAAKITAPLEAAPVAIPEVYVVQPGESLHLIAFRYGVNYRDLISWNGISNPDRILAGQKLRLVSPYITQQVPSSPAAVVQAPPTPVYTEPVVAAPATQEYFFPMDQPKVRELPPEPMAQPTVPSIAIAQPIAPVSVAPPAPKLETGPSMPERVAGSVSWRWPMKGKLKRKFRPDVPGRKGIQIGGKLGQGIWAASAGEVVYSGSGLPGYGRLIIIKHSEEILSAYGYLGKIKVTEGEKVKPGQIIAEVGASPENKPVLHFEIRKQGDPVNPLDYLPG